MNYKKYNDYELIYMVRENDDVSRDLLFKKYRPVVSSIVSDFYNRYKEYGYDYDDFYQEALLSFDRAVMYYDEGKDTLFYTFLVMCIKRNLLSFTRNISNSTKNISRKVIDSIDDVDVVDEKTDLKYIFKEKEIQDISKKIIYNSTLPIEDTAMLELRLNGFNYREIGELLEIPSSSIEFRFRRIRRKLKHELSK